MSSSIAPPVPRVNAPADTQRMNIVIVGHVDHGKSTVIGRLLADTHSLPEGKLEQIRAQCELNSKPFEYAFLLDALKFGAPPHGGIALGLDRWSMMLAGTTNIRDVIAFPKNQKARDLMTGAPAPVDAKQLKELGLNP